MDLKRFVRDSTPPLHHLGSWNHVQENLLIGLKYGNQVQASKAFPLSPVFFKLTVLYFLCSGRYRHSTNWGPKPRWNKSADLGLSHSGSANRKCSLAICELLALFRIYNVLIRIRIRGSSELNCETVLRLACIFISMVYGWIDGFRSGLLKRFAKENKWIWCFFLF